MFDGLYDNASAWNRLISTDGAAAQLLKNLFRGEFYEDAGILMLVLPLGVCVFYYYYLNRRFGKYYQGYQWVVTLFVSEILLFASTICIGFMITSRILISRSHFIFHVGFLNILYGLITFSVFSVIIKWGSPMGKRTPF